MVRVFGGIWRDEDGTASVEYAMLLAVVVVGCIGAWTGLREKLVQAVDDVQDSLNK